MEQQALSVSQLNRYIKMLIERDEVLCYVVLNGEISNFKYHTSGHLYFTLKDQESEIAAVMFRSFASRLAFEPKNGMSVRVYGRVSVYEKGGKYQLYVDAMTEDGMGLLFAEYERLKKKLEAEGLFDEKKKRPLPEYPRCVGVVTSPTGAAIRDIINISGRRYPAAKLLICPALVQGVEAPESVCSALRLLYACGNCDVIIVGRGGGSAEDLWAFNNEEVVRTVAESPVPIISAVGHETDFTLCDLAADKRAPTPSAAAELALPDAAELLMRLGDISDKLDVKIDSRINELKNKTTDKLRLLSLSSPNNKVKIMRERLERGQNMLHTSMLGKNEMFKISFAKSLEKLEAMNPLAVMQRGYSALRDMDGGIIDSVKKLNSGDKVELVLCDGHAEALVGSVISK